MEDMEVYEADILPPVVSKVRLGGGKSYEPDDQVWKEGVEEKTPEEEDSENESEELPKLMDWPRYFEPA